MPDFSLRTDYLAATSQFMSTEETRYYLRGVFVTPHEIEAEGRGMLMVATDGHCMAILYDAWGYASRPAILSMNFNDKEMKVPRKELGVRRLVVDDGGSSSLYDGVPCGVVAQNNEAETLNTGFRPRAYVTVKEVQGTYPDFWRVVPKVKNSGPAKPYGWNVAYMAKLVKAAKLLGQDTPKASFRQDSPRDPAFVTLSGCPNAGFIYMPLRIDDLGAPAWLAEPTAKAGKIAAE
jgi:hypothetical protein